MFDDVGQISGAWEIKLLFFSCSSRENYALMLLCFSLALSDG